MIFEKSNDGGGIFNLEKTKVFVDVNHENYYIECYDKGGRDGGVKSLYIKLSLEELNLLKAKLAAPIEQGSDEYDNHFDHDEDSYEWPFTQ